MLVAGTVPGAGGALIMSEHRILRQGGVATLVVIAACVAVAVPAYGTWTDTHEKSITLRSPGAGVVTAECPAGEQATAGGIGVAVTPALDTNNGVLPRAMFLNSAQTGWTVAAFDLFFPGVLTARVYCDKHPLFTVVSKKVTAVAGELTASATCPAGKFVLSAGYSFPALTTNPASFITHLRATAGKVTATIVVKATLLTTLKAYAYCGPGPRATETAAAVNIGGRSSLKTVVATCPSGLHFLFGGFDGAYTLLGPHVIPFSMSSPSIGKWQVSGLDDIPPGTGPAPLTAYAYCR
jgi:hypothetical protein